MSHGRGRWRRETTDARQRLRARIAEAERLAASGELTWALYQDGDGRRYLWPSGPEKVIESSTYAEPGQAEAAHPEREIELPG